jgi:hypothetical protein
MSPAQSTDWTGLGPADARKTRKNITSVAEDDLKELLKNMKKISSYEKMKELMFHPPPRQLTTSDDIRKYVKEQLSIISSDTRSHREVCTDVTFDMTKCLPRPWSLAIEAYAEANSLHAEALTWCLYANLSFLEHPSRRIGHRLDSPHTQVPNIPVLIGGAESSGKSFLIATTTNMMTQCAYAPPDAFGNRECILSDARLAGLRRCLCNHHRAAVVCDEASNVYDTPWKDVSSGLRYLAKTKIRTYVMSEPDYQVTGQHEIHLGGEEHCYLFHHKAHGGIHGIQTP